MKKKLLVLTLCFTLIFSSLNYKKSYADGGIVSLPILATVSALAVGTGIALNNLDDVYDLGYGFYEYVKNHNSMTWDALTTFFNASVSVGANKFINVNSEFLEFVKGFFDSKFATPGEIVFSPLPFVGDLTGQGLSARNKLQKEGLKFHVNKEDFIIGDYFFKYISSGSAQKYDVYYYDELIGSQFFINDHTFSFAIGVVNGVTMLVWANSYVGSGGRHYYYLGDSDSTVKYPHSMFAPSIPYEGGYDWGKVNDKINENNELPLPIPGNVGSLVGQSSKDFWDNTDDLVGNGDLSIPGVSNPSIPIGGATSFPSVGDNVGNPSLPNEGIWSTVKDFIISLVVPSDTFWTDTWGGLYNSFTGAFPMVDMDNFNKLVTNEKKFPNIDVDIMGVKGRIVNGDVINSIVDWLRPIVAGFMMLCLMFFNYRKIYKLIRNSEPFGGLASGNNSEINTGISEYSKQEVVKAVDMASEYRAWRERGGR